jgi:hypothetical protein
MSRKLFAATAVVLALTHSWAQAKEVLDVSKLAETSFTRTAATGGTFIVTNTEIQPTGTGVIDPFLRIQQSGQERGYNTSDTTGQPPLDDVPPIGGFTRAIQLSAIPIVTISGVAYREFLLDVNQVANGNISLNQVQIFQSPAGVGATGFTLQEADTTHDAVISFPSATQIFQMSSSLLTGTAYEVQINSSHGSGSGDMFLYVNNTAFAGLSPTTFITLFSQFGNPPGAFASNAGFEEWATRNPTVTPVPEPTTVALSLSGLGTLGFVGLRRLRRRPVVV